MLHGKTIKTMLICHMIYHRGGNIITAVEIIDYHRGGNISNAVEILSPRWKYYHRGGNISTAVEIVFHLIQYISLDLLQGNRDFIDFHFIHVGSSS